MVQLDIKQMKRAQGDKNLITYNENAFMGTYII